MEPAGNFSEQIESENNYLSMPLDNEIETEFLFSILRFIRQYSIIIIKHWISVKLLTKILI